MNVNIHPSWKQKLNFEFQKPYFQSLTDFVREEYKINTCYPPGSQIFSAFDLCTFDNLKVVIIGQDPYHGDGQANGLCFSVADGISHPPSLINIFKELESDLNIPYPTSGNLERWATQGVLLLNATLTVRAKQPGSHQNKGWERFTDHVIEIISNECKNIVFLLWGGYAKKKIKLINTQDHVVLTSGHPSPLSANRGYWFGNKHFSRTNSELKSRNLGEISW
ncbi:uracil-DNA glycosylase [Psychroserpens sp.]|uniref:uracil-DNA glycosylase n=1 Tax=Psychroserpens sp. TaxID=2020870 RepID=UPI001B1BAABB|nr:uracil-DNA glycosylase [Psychroserpens sp.]MBO6606517.1 uracil-DNA glycosylase [Psychroserpens sp.]MBO6653221.1 uracil-DNA glycosylase [Psychroserpens sp.]MBO6680752.1 uracil-DNA glycosylase [Psychroserpens sp.]MBO6750290.1 uracil-DNA glycosylase [Psychroserpens sp.]MBO6914772.1 uracil-DNA glycosylase [Psychroserpens sp.]